MTDERMIELESKIGHQDFIIEKLTTAVAEQEVAIFKLGEALTAMSQSLKQLLEGDVDNGVRSHEKPPHY